MSHLDPDLGQNLNPESNQKNNLNKKYPCEGFGKYGIQFWQY